MSTSNAIDAYELREFISSVATRMRLSQRDDLAEILERANKFFLPPLTSEFYGEAMLALQHAIEAQPVSADFREQALVYVRLIKERYFASPM